MLPAPRTTSSYSAQFAKARCGQEIPKQSSRINMIRGENLVSSTNCVAMGTKVLRWPPLISGMVAD